jgi:acyl transferase domain-containing protein
MASSLAIVGMSCRFAGDIDTPEKFWGLIRDGRDGIGGLPNDRGWDLGELYDPAPSVPGKFYVKDGYFLRDPYGFDSDFFGISPREAKVTHPQQRITLELAWEALERAGIPPLSRRGTRSGVFIGCSNNMSYPPIEDEASAAALEHYRGTSTTSFAVSGRVSYTLGLEGAAITLDTGCSSGLVALHLAGQSLRLGECDLALVGGITVITDPDELTYFSRQRMSAPDGRCKPFSADADGSSFGEGACLLVLERLEDARRQGHPVLATVLGSAVGQDGATGAGLTAPSTPAQVKVIRAALDSAGLDPGQVDAVEAHGTGTVVGDPIEANALIEAYGQGRRPDDPLLVGSVKSNIGHT